MTEEPAMSFTEMSVDVNPTILWPRQANPTGNDRS